MYEIHRQRRLILQRGHLIHRARKRLIDSRFSINFAEENNYKLNTMKYKTLSFLVLLLTFAVISCGNKPSSVPIFHNPDKPQNIAVVDKSYMEVFDMCEVLSQWYESNEEMYEVMGEAEADSSIRAWAEFKDVCSKGKLYKAKELMINKPFEGKLILYLRNSTAQYHYYAGIKYQILSQVDSALAQKELLEDLEFNLASVDCVVALQKSSGSFSIPPHYGELLNDYIFVLVNNGDYEKAGTLPEKLYEYCILDGLTKEEAELRKSFMETRYTCLTSDSKIGLKAIERLHARIKDDAELSGKADNIRGMLMEDLLWRKKCAAL